jgi:hypothetical protein
MVVEFIELNRKFNPVPTNDSEEKDQSDFYSMESLDGIHWDKLLTFTRVVILAEAGSGKTEEIKNQSKKLLNDEEFSFFLRLEDIQEGFEIAFELGNMELFQQWLDSDKKAYFFLDSVDEAKLKNEKDFQKAIRIFERKIHKAISRTYVFITSRGSAWRASSDLKFLNELLRYKEHTKVGEDANSGSIQDFSVYSFTNLSNAQIKAFSSALGVEDTEEFAKQLRINEAEDFAKRPLDLLDLIRFWKANSKIGTRYELINSSINNKIAGEDIGRDLVDISFQRLMNGAKEIAAALTFCKLSRVTIPSGVQIKDALTIEQILGDWNNKEIETLLSRPIFEPSWYGTSRFAHRLIREFLTALWIKERVNYKTIDQDDLRTIFYRQVYDVEVLVPALKPILAWYVLLDDQFSSVVIDKSPEVFIEGGDSSKLSIEKRQQLLSKFCNLYGKKEQCFISFDSAAIKRFSDPEMGALINNLIQKYYSYQELSQILLQIAVSSTMPECLEIAKKISLDSETQPFSLTLALRLINKVADNDLKLSHAACVLDIIPCNNERILSVVVAELGELIPIRKLLNLVSALSESDKSRFRGIRYHVETFAEGLNIDKSMEGLELLYELVDSKPYKRAFRCEISEKHEWLMGVVQVFVINILGSKNESLINTTLLGSVTKACSYNETGYRKVDQKHEIITKLVNGWKQLKEELFWFDVCLSRARLIKEKGNSGRDVTLNRWFQVGTYCRFWQFNIEDLNTVVGWVDSKELNDDKLIAFSLAWSIVKENGRKAADEYKIDQVAENLDGAVRLLYDFRNPKKADWEIKDEIQHKKLIEEQTKIEKVESENAESWIISIKENLELVDTLEYANVGKITNVQLHLFEMLRKDSNDSDSYIITDCSPLKGKFGVDVTVRYEKFLVNYWKCFEDNILLSEGSERNSTTYPTIMALSGIYIENKLHPNWIDFISVKNAVTATRLSLCDLNAIPNWMSKVYAKFPTEVLSLYTQCLEWSYEDQSKQDNSNFVLDKLISNCEYLHKDIAESVFSLLKLNTVSKYHLLRQSIWLLSLSGITNDRLSKLAIYKLEHKSEDILSYMWWSLYVGTEPESSLRLFTKELDSLKCEDATNLAMNVLNCLNDKRGYGALTNRHEYMNVPNLVTLYKLMNKYIREEDDIIRAGQGCYSPTARDDAQDARNSLFSALKEISGEESYKALKQIAQMWKDKPWRKSWIENMALERAAKDGDLKAMSEKDFAEYSEKVSKKEEPNMNIGDVINSTVVQNSGELNNSEIANTVDSSKVEIDSNELCIEPAKDKKSWHETGKGKISLILIAVVLTFVAKEFIAPIL